MFISLVLKMAYNLNIKSGAENVHVASKGQCARLCLTRTHQKMR